MATVICQGCGKQGKSNKAKIKEKANSLSELCLTDVDSFAQEFTALYDNEEYTEGECSMILQLCDVYTAVKQGLMNREEARAEQKIIFSGGKCE